MSENYLPLKDDSRVGKIEQVLPPIALLDKYPLTPNSAQLVRQTRQGISDILQGKSDRLLVVIGPCSIHDPKSALEYAKRLKTLRDVHSGELEIIMRAYFEKPRTTVGWKGLINDPYLNHSYALNDGLQIARKLLADINALGVPTAGEFLDMITPQYLADFMSWGAIGARTTESQVHRELASGLPCPVGFKNSTNGSVKTALDAIHAAKSPHSFLSVTKFGHSAIISTKGNEDCHIILRGGENGTNYDENAIHDVALRIQKMGGLPHVMVDFSHANSQKDFKKQLTVCESVSAQLAQGSREIFGVMIESHLQAGRQDLVENAPLIYGQSITDACLGWTDSALALATLAEAVKTRRKRIKIP